MKKNQCFVCKKKCNLQCSKCRCIGYCDATCQLKDWPNHKLWCDMLASSVRNKYINAYEKRKSILQCKDHREQENQMKDLMSYLKRRLSQIKMMIPTSFTLTSEAKIFMLYDYCQEYLCTILLMVKLYLIRGDKSNAKKALDYLYLEWEKDCQKNKFDEYFVNRPGVIAMNKNYKNYKIYLKKYLRLYTSCIFCSYEIGNQCTIMQSISMYLRIGEGLATNERIYQSYCPWIALMLGRFFVANTMPAVSISCYEVAIKYLGTDTCLVESGKNTVTMNTRYNDIINLNLNSALVYFIIDNHDKAIEKINEAIILTDEWSAVTNLKNKIIVKLLYLYRVKAMIEAGYKKFISAYENCEKYIDISKENEEMLSHDYTVEFAKMNDMIIGIMNLVDKNIVQEKVNSMKEFPIKKLNAKNTLTSSNHFKKKSSTVAQSFKKRLRIEKEQMDYEDFNNFFLFLTKLSMYQILILNQTQPVFKDEKLYVLPIHFSDVFKSCLTKQQRFMLFEINGMNLSRKKVLSDPKKPISFSNLNYKEFYPEIIYGNKLCLKKKNSYNKLIESMKRLSRFSYTGINEQLMTSPLFSSVLNLESLEKDKEDPEARDNVEFLLDKKEFLFGKYKDAFYLIKKNLVKFLDKLKIERDKEVSYTRTSNDTDESRSFSVEEQQDEYDLTEKDDEIIMNILKKTNEEDQKDLIDNPALVFDLIQERRNLRKNEEESNSLYMSTQGGDTLNYQ